jgi:hypothetical protein
MKRLSLLLTLAIMMTAMMLSSSLTALAKHSDGWTGNTGKSFNGGAWVYQDDKGGGKPIVVNKNGMKFSS